MAKFTFTRDYFERQPGPKRRFKDWRAGETYTMTKDHAHQLQENCYGYLNDTSETMGESEMVGRSVSDHGVLDD